MQRRDLSTRLAKAGRLSLVFEPRDCWIGVFAGPDAIYVCLLPCVAFRWERRPPRRIRPESGLTSS